MSTNVIALALAAGMVVAAPALADFRMERELELAPGGSFILDTDVGAVTVVGTSRSNARVVMTARRDDVESLYDIRFDVNPGEVRVQVDKKMRNFWRGMSGVGMKFEIEVPTDTRVNIDTSGGGITVSDLRGDAVLDTSGGPIKVDGVDGKVSADTSGGGISVRSVTGSVNLDTSGGPIQVEAVDGDIRADTSGGGITIEGARGHVDADTSGGPISATFAAGNARGGRLSTSGGGITVQLDPNVSLTIDASTSGGRVHTEMPIEVLGTVSKSQLEGKLNGGGELLKLSTSGGGIRIESR